MIWGVMGACNSTVGTVEYHSSNSTITADATLTENGSCSLDLPSTLTDEETIVALLNKEGAFVVQQDIVGLMRLWATDGQVSDAKHTPADPADDQIWQGADAIRHRYVRWVFPGAPAVARPANLVISIASQKAVVTGTTRIGPELSPAGDRWLLVKKTECWVIQELTFNLELP